MECIFQCQIMEREKNAAIRGFAPVFGQQIGDKLPSPIRFELVELHFTSKLIFPNAFFENFDFVRLKYFSKILQNPYFPPKSSISPFNLALFYRGRSYFERVDFNLKFSNLFLKFFDIHIGKICLALLVKRKINFLPKKVNHQLKKMKVSEF